MSKDDITNKEILEAIHAFSTHVDAEIGDLKYEINGIKSEISSMKSEIGGIKSEIGSMKSEINSIKSQMVTKDYLDRKLWDLQGDMVAMTRREIERHEIRFHTAQ